jgi:hypothetical protein
MGILFKVFGATALTTSEVTEKRGMKVGRDVNGERWHAVMHPCGALRRAEIKVV